MSRKFAFVCLGVLLGALTIYLLAAHYVKAYSDPIGFVSQGEKMLGGTLVSSRALLYPFFIASLLPLLGDVYIFLANLPPIIVLGLLIYVLTCQLAQGHGRDVRLAGLMSAALFVIYDRFFLLELLNPFREPLAFSLMLGSVIAALSFARTQKRWLGMVLGLLLGLATSTRETCVLMAFPFALWWLVQWAIARHRVWVQFALLAAVGLMVGLGPSFIQNYLESGNVAVPSYAAGYAQGLSDIEERVDIPIPGMSVRYFDEVSKKTIAHLYDKLGPTGWGLFILGIVVALFRRNVGVLLIMLPAVVLNTFFYCFYSYAKERYLFVVEVLAIPVMGLGLAALCAFMFHTLLRLRDLRLLRARQVGAVCMVMLTIGLMFDAYGDKRDRLQVWHVKKLRAAIEPYLEEPATFVGRRHHVQLLSWLVDGEMFELTMKFIRRGKNEVLSVEKALKKHSALALGRLEEGNYYFYGENRPTLLRAWFDFDHVMSFANLPAPLDHYGRIMDKGLYQVSPWTQKQVEHTFPITEEADYYVLKSSFYRVWDYDRSYCRLYAGDDVLLDRVPNDAFFAMVPARYVKDGKLTLRVESDGPLPKKPHMELIPQGDDVYVAFGAGHDVWYYEHVEQDLMARSHLKDDGFIYFDEGSIKLPCAGDDDERVFAAIRVEYIQEDAYLRGLHHHRASTRYGTVKMPLPPRRQTGYITAELGRGNGRVRYEEVKLLSDLPSRLEQRILIKKYLARFKHGVKVIDATMYSIPADPVEELTIDVGAKKDGAYLVQGFYQSESDAVGKLRWTEPHAKLRLPLRKSGQDYTVLLRIKDARPEDFPANPQFTFNDWNVPPDQVTAVMKSGMTTVSFDIPADVVVEGDDVLTIDVNAWNPMSDSNIKDHRTLGVMVYMVGAQPKAN